MKPEDPWADALACRPPPPDATGGLWGFLAWMALVFSPFAGFALHGRVDEVGLRLGLVCGLLPLAALLALAWRRHRRVQAMPPALRALWRDGVRVPAEGAPEVPAPVQLVDGPARVGWTDAGLVFGRRRVLRLQGGPDRLARVMALEAAGQWFVAWEDLQAWSVESDSDSPDPYRVTLRDGSQLLLARLSRGRDERALLDAVRSRGRVAVQLRDELRPL